MDDTKRIEDKLDKIVDTQVEQAVTLARLTVSVEDHVMRTNILQEAIEPIKRHAAMVEGALKLIALMGIAATIIETIHRILQ